MKINKNWMETVDTGSGHEGITWDTTIHSMESIEYSNLEEQVKQEPNPETMGAPENAGTGVRGEKDRDGQSTTTTP